MTESDDKVTESNQSDSVDDTEESIDETPKSSEKSARVVSFDEDDQIINSHSKQRASRKIDNKQVNSTQHLLPSSGLLKQALSYS